MSNVKTIHDALERFLLAKTGEVASTTTAWYKSLLAPMADDLAGQAEDLDAITITHLRRWRARLIHRTTLYTEHPYREEINARQLSIYTVHDTINACRIFFTWLHREQEIQHNPAALLKPPKLPRHKEPKAISERDIRKLVREAYRRDNLRDVALISVLADTGARIGGVSGLRIRDIDLKAGEMIVTEKGNKSRRVYLTDAGVQAVRAYLRVRPSVDHDYVWVSLLGGALTESGCYKALERLADATGVENFNPHAFRHAYARELLRYGVSLERVKELMGHEDISTTANCYGIWTRPELRATHYQASEMRNLWDGVGN